MAVRVVTRRGERRLVIDIRYTKSDGTPGRYRKDAEVQTMAAARAEDRRRLATLTFAGAPDGDLPAVAPSVTASPPAEAEPTAKRSTAPSFSSVAEDYLQSFATSQLKPSTRHGYTAVIHGILIPRIGKSKVDEIDATKVREIDAVLVKRKVRPSTRRNVQVVLRSILCRYAVEAGILSEPPRLPRLPKVGEKVVDTLTTEELKRILATSGKESRLAFLLAAHAGLRAGEVRALRWRDVNFDANQLVVRQSTCRGFTDTPKSGHERVVPLTVELREVLEAQPKRERNDLVSRTSRGTQWGQFSLYKAFLSACEDVGVTGRRFHDLRHYFVTALFRAGVPARTVQQLAGHAHLTTTQRYAHVVAGDLERAVRVMGEQWVTGG